MSRPEEILHAFGHLPVEAILAPVKAESEPTNDSFERRIKAVNRAADQHLIQLRDSMIAQGMDRNKANAAVAGYLSADAHGAGGEGEDDATFDRRYREELRQLLLVLNRGNSTSQQHGGGGGWRAEVDYEDPRAVIFEAPPLSTATGGGGGGGNASKRNPSPTPHHQHVSSHKPHNSGAAECEEEDEQPTAMSPTPKYPGNQQQQRFPPVHTTKSNAPSYNSTPRHHMTASSNMATKAPQHNSTNGTPFRPTNNGPSMRTATTTNSSNHHHNGHHHHGMGSQSDAPVIVKSTGNQGNGAMIRSAKGAVGSNHPFTTANLPFGVVDVDRSSTQFAARDSDLSVRTNQSEGISAHGGAGFLYKGGGGHQNGAQTRTSVFTTPPAFKGL